MRKLTGFFILLVLSNPLWASDRAYFLILEENASINDTAAQIIDMGGTIQFQVPPRILSAELSHKIEPSRIPNVQSFYSGFVPMEVISPLGPLAISAGRDWNRSRANETKQMGAMSFKSAKAQLASDFVPAPKDLNLNPNLNVLEVQWRAVFGAEVYQTQISEDKNFSSVLIQSFSEGPSIILPNPADRKKTLFLRVRGVEKLRSDGVFEDVPGAWSVMKFESIVGIVEEISPPPQLTSPVNGMESQGFLITLEWTGLANQTKRVQVSDSKTFKNTLSDVAVNSNEFICPSSVFQIGKTYFWRVKEWGASERSPWSESRNFSVGEPRQIDGDMMINPEAPR